MGVQSFSTSLAFLSKAFSLLREPQNLNAGPAVCVPARLSEHMLCLRAHCDRVCLGERRRVNMYVYSVVCRSMAKQGGQCNCGRNAPNCTLHHFLCSHSAAVAGLCFRPLPSAE